LRELLRVVDSVNATTDFEAARTHRR
jgi:hypothetical protein